MDFSSLFFYLSVCVAVCVKLTTAQIFQYFIVNNKDQTAKVIDTIKLPTCTHLDQKDNVTLRGGIKAGKFLKHGVVKDMKTCIDACCQDETCNVAFMPGNNCYTVNCYSEQLCESIPATPSHLAQGGVQISHIIRGGGKGDDVDEFRKKNGVNRNSLPNGDQCTFSRAAYNQTIAGGKDAGEIIDLGKFTDTYDCASKCCEHENCEVAHVRDGKCYAVDCFTKDLCSSRRSQSINQPAIVVYMNKRNGVRQQHKGKCSEKCKNGLCINNNGTCSCDVGFKGKLCNQLVNIGRCDPSCGIHGSCITNDSCLCEQGWHGYKCDRKVKCKDDCINGLCVDKKSNLCRCDVSWSGYQCNETTNDKVVLASSGEEVLFTDSDVEPELDIKIHDSPSVHETESISALAVAICCGVAAAVLGTAAIVFIAKQMLVKRSISTYEYLNNPVHKNHSPQHRHHRRHHP